MLRGAVLAADQINARGGVIGPNGKPGYLIKIVKIDDAANPATGVAAAKRAITAGLNGVVGPYNSGVGEKTLPLYLKAGLVPFRLTSANATSRLGITLQPMTYQIAPVASQALTKWLTAKSVAVIYDSTASYTTAEAKAVMVRLRGSGAGSPATGSCRVSATTPQRWHRLQRRNRARSTRSCTTPRRG